MIAEPESAPPTDALIEPHLEWCPARNLRPSTIERRRVTLLRLARDFDRPLDELTEGDLERWYKTLTHRMSAGSRGTELSHIVSYYRWLMRERIRPDDPTTRLDRPRHRRRLPRPIPDADLRRALDSAPARIRPWLLLAALEGLRAAEVANLRREDVLESADPPVLIVTAGKGDKQRVLPLHPLVVAALPLNRRGWLFPRLDGNPGHVGANTVSRLACEYFHAIGISSTFHALRHRFGTEAYRLSLDLRLVQEMLGHSDPSTTAGYCAWTPSRAAGVVDALTV